MRRIKKENYHNEGVFINLDTEYIPYEKLIYSPEKYLNKYYDYYIYCKHGIKSYEVAKTLELKGYHVSQII